MLANLIEMHIINKHIALYIGKLQIYPLLTTIVSDVSIKVIARDIQWEWYVPENTDHQVRSDVWRGCSGSWHGHSERSGLGG
jgi:hypothetical protein